MLQYANVMFRLKECIYAQMCMYRENGILAAYLVKPGLMGEKCVYLLAMSKIYLGIQMVFDSCI